MGVVGVFEGPFALHERLGFRLRTNKPKPGRREQVRSALDLVIILVPLVFNRVISLWEEFQAGNAIEQLKGTFDAQYSPGALSHPLIQILSHKSVVL